MKRIKRLAGVATLAAAALFTAACGIQDTTSPAMSPAIGDVTASAMHIPFEPESEMIEVCKVYPAGVTGPDVRFDYVIDRANDGSVDETGYVTLGGGECTEVTIGGTLAFEDRVVITEVVPAGYTTSFVAKEIHMGVLTVYPAVASATATGYMNGHRGFTFIYTNTNRGLAGCSHGYWKAEQHADSWPAPYTPDTPFDDAFENAFPGMTMGEVLAQGGGGLNALGREAVAALLNAATGFYWYSPGEVVSMFDAAFPGTKADYEALKYLFEVRNLAGCTLD